jgi:tyrosyl-tRNA synthetase
MNLDERLDLACQGTVEVIQKTELQELLKAKPKPRAYWGFECSGKRADTRPV